MVNKALNRCSGDALEIIKFHLMIDPRFKRKKMNVTEQLEEDFLVQSV